MSSAPDCLDNRTRCEYWDVIIHHRVRVLCVLYCNISGSRRRNSFYLTKKEMKKTEKEIN